jgi:hypothetical protein
MTNKSNTNSNYLQQEIGSASGGWVDRVTRLRPRLVIILGVALLGILLAIFVGGRFLLSQGEVAIAAGSQSDLLSSRAYQFTGEGQITGGSGTTWIIGGVPIQVSSQTQIENGIHPGDEVSVAGHISQSGKWLADGINLIPDSDSFFSFGGPLEARSQTAWKVAGITVTVNDQTKLGASLQDNELVLVTFKVTPDGTWLAQDIESLSAVATPSPIPPTATNQPSSNDNSSNNSTVSNPKPPSDKPSKKNDIPPGCNQNNGKGKGNDKHGNGHNPCSGSGQGNNNEGGD